jgi:hypothetical protein
MADAPEALLSMQLRDQPVPLRLRRPDLPKALEQLVDELMAKNRESRPANAQLVGTRIRAIRAAVPDTEPLHEADRGTVKAADQAPVASPTATIGRTTTIADGKRGSAAVGLEAGETREAAQPMVLTPAALGELTRPRGLVALTDDADGPTDKAAPGVVTRWPTPPSRRRPKRRRWRAAVSALVTAAILGAVAVILWQRVHEQLKVTAVAVAPAQLPGNRCNVTVNVVGTIETNGHGGTVSYRWIRGGGLTSPVSAVLAASGHATVKVYLRWTFRGSGTYHAAAKLRVLTPDGASGQTAFTYSCTG